MDNGIFHENLMVESSPDMTRKEVKDNTEMVEAKKRDQNTGAECSMKLDQVPFYVR